MRLDFLWYRWRNEVLVLSRSVSESAQPLEDLRGCFESDKELRLLLKKLSYL